VCYKCRTKKLLGFSRFLDRNINTVKPSGAIQTLMRWFILSLMFIATTINYLDRAILGVLLPEIRGQFHISTDEYGAITFGFQMAYAVGSLIGGKLLDKYGTRIGYGLAAALWSVAATLNAFAASALQFGMLRTMLGLGESANFPACNKAAAELFPPSQRATVMGVVNFGTNLANVIGPPLFIWIALTVNWQTCFAIIGGIGFLWLPAWFLGYPSPLRLGAPKQEVSKLSMKAVMRYRQSWGYATAKFLTDPVWWFYLFWIPTYLNDVRHLTAAGRATALTVIYAISGVGAVLGGLISGYLIKRGWHVGKARKTVMLVCAAIMPISALGVVIESTTHAILLFSIGLAAHQAWMTNLFTTPADVFPKQAVGSTNGFGVCVGAIGGALFSGLIPGYVIPVAGYVPVLITMSFFYIVAWVLVHWLMGDLEPISLHTETVS
jgi:ACS family hexuronate transporter-like MFS transporter